MADRSPYTHPVAVTSLPAGGLDVTLRAKPAELVALAADLKLPAIGALAADFTLTPARAGSVQVTGEVRATVTQICVVTLEPFEAEVREEVDVTFAPWASRTDQATIGHDLDEPDPPDPLEGGVIDVGNLAAEFLALGLEAHPRKPDAKLDFDASKEKLPSPFAALAALRQDRPDEDNG